MGFMLRLAVRDATAGFRAYRRSIIEKIGLERVRADGYGFQVELTYRALRRGFRVREVPITFVERERGASKMSRSIVTEALWLVTRWGAERLLARRGAHVRA
jgi:dolichol-phosphate mannosyltransferase